MKDPYSEYKHQYRIKNQDRMMEYLSTHSCVDCGESDPVVLEFDHVGEKKFNISRALTGTRSWGAILKEIEKCEVRCANCHRRKTSTANGCYRVNTNKQTTNKGTVK